MYFSYDAAEDNELSFQQGDRITEIDKVDEDWWQGKANGASGLFPGKCQTGLGQMIPWDCVCDRANIVAAYVVAEGDYEA